MAFNTVNVEALATFSSKGSASRFGLKLSPEDDSVQCAAAAPRSESLLFGGKRNGEVFAMNLSASRAKNVKLDDDDGALRPIAQSKTSTLGFHKGPVTCIAYYPVRKLLFTGSVDATVCVWDPLQMYQKTNGSVSGYRIQIIPAHDATVSVIAVHCNVLVSGSVDKTVKVWMLDERREGLAIPLFVAKQAFVFDNWITSIHASLTKATEVLSEDIFVGDGSGNVTSLHSVMTPMLQKGAVEDHGVLQVELVRHSRIVHDAQRAGASDATPKSITAILPLPSINSIVTLGFDNAATITDTAKGSALGTIEHPESSGAGRVHLAPKRFVDLLFLPAREEILLLDNVGSLLLWDTRTNQFLCTRKSHPKRVAKALVAYQSLGSGPQPSYIPAGDASSQFLVVYDDGIDLCHVLHIKTVTELKGHEGKIISVQVNHLSEYAALSSAAPNTSGSAAAGDESRRLEEGEEDAATREGLGGASDSSDVAFVTAGVDNRVCMWSSRLSLIRSLTEKFSEISSCYFAPHLDFCVTGHDNGSVKFWGLSRERHIRFTAHDNTIAVVGEGLHRYDKRLDRMIAWNHFFTASYDGCLAVWDVPVENSKPKCEGRVRASNSELVCAVYDPIKHAYIVGDNNGCITIWSVDDLKPLKALQHLVRAGPPSSRAPPTRRPAHAEAVTSMALDGNIVVSGGEDRCIFLWNTVTGECVKEVRTQPAIQEPVSLMKTGFGEIQELRVYGETGDIFACTRLGLVVQFQQSTGLPVAYYKAQAEVNSFCINPYGNEVMMGLENGNLVRAPIHMFKPILLSADTDDDDDTLGFM